MTERLESESCSDSGNRFSSSRIYAGYRLAHAARPLKLVLIGPRHVRISERLCRGALDFGLVPIQDEYDAYAAAFALGQPSLRESFPSW